MYDSGCTKTVCGSFWLQCHKNSPDEQDQANIVYEPSIRTFKFGDSKVIKSTHMAYVPAYIGNRKVSIETEFVNKEPSLLLSKKAMKTAGMIRDFTNDSAPIFGFHANMEITSSGHYTIPLSKARINNNMNQVEEKAFIAVDVDKMSYQEKEKMVTKLHNQFGYHLYDELRDKKLPILAQTTRARNSAAQPPKVQLSNVLLPTRSIAVGSGANRTNPQAQPKKYISR